MGKTKWIALKINRFLNPTEGCGVRFFDSSVVPAGLPDI